jgi:hypothetical protein
VEEEWRRSGGGAEEWRRKEEGGAGRRRELGREEVERKIEKREIFLSSFFAGRLKISFFLSFYQLCPQDDAFESFADARLGENTSPDRGIPGGLQRKPHLRA